MAAVRKVVITCAVTRSIHTPAYRFFHRDFFASGKEAVWHLVAARGRARKNKRPFLLRKKVLKSQPAVNLR